MNSFSRRTHVLPLPGGERVGVRGLGRARKTPASDPPHPRSLRSLDLSPPGRGEMNSFSRRSRVRVLFDSSPARPQKPRGGGAPTGAPTIVRAAHQVLPLECAAGAEAHPAGRARLSALHRGTRLGDRTPPLSFGPRFLEKPGANGLLALPGPSAASSSQTGHSAGRAGSRSRAPDVGVIICHGKALYGRWQVDSN